MLAPFPTNILQVSGCPRAAQCRGVHPLLIRNIYRIILPAAHISIIYYVYIRNLAYLPMHLDLIITGRLRCDHFGPLNEEEFSPTYYTIYIYIYHTLCYILVMIFLTIEFQEISWLRMPKYQHTYLTFSVDYTPFLNQNFAYLQESVMSGNMEWSISLASSVPTDHVLLAVIISI